MPVEVPYILYSKVSNPTFLSKSGVSHLIKWSSPTGPPLKGYTLTWPEAENFSETHLHVPIATLDDVN